MDHNRKKSMSRRNGKDYLIMDSKGRWVVGFGKYKGVFLDDAIWEDTHYFEWLLGKDIPEHVYEIIDTALDSM